MKDEQQQGEKSFLQQLISMLKDHTKDFPQSFQDRLFKELQSPLRMIESSRYPRVAMVGRTRAGKSALLNAIFERVVSETSAIQTGTKAVVWTMLTGPSGEPMIQILDTRGFQEPTDTDNKTTSEKATSKALRNAAPDVIVFVTKATEVNAAIQPDVAALAKILETVHQAHNFYPLVVGVLSQCDNVEPPYVKTASDRVKYPDAWEEKQRNINQACADLQLHFERHETLHKNQKIVAISAYAQYGNDGMLIPDPVTDWRWNIDALKRVLVEEIPEDARLIFSRNARVRSYQRKYARRVIHACSAATGLLGTQPIPLTDMPALTTIQLLMVASIAYIAGKDFSIETAKDFLVAAGINIGVGFALREAARALLRLIPVGGSALSGTIALAGTEGIGKLAMLYFIQGASIDQVKAQARLFPGKIKKAAERGDTIVEVEGIDDLESED